MGDICRVGTKFSKEDLRRACDTLFKSLDEDKSGALDVEEMVSTPLPSGFICHPLVCERGLVWSFPRGIVCHH